MGASGHVRQPMALVASPPALRLVFVALLLVTALAFGLRVFRIGEQSLRGDEAFSVTFARLPWSEMGDHLRTDEAHPPLFYASLRAWTQLAGESELSVRFYPLFFGVLIVPLVYRLGREVGTGNQTAVLAALLAALSPFIVWNSQDVRMYTLLLALATASGLLLLRLLRQESALVWLGYISVTTACLLSHYSGVFVILLENLAFLTVGWRRLSWRHWLTGQAAVAVLFAPWLVFTSGMIFSHAKDWIPLRSLSAILTRSLEVYSLGLRGTAVAGDLVLWGFLALFALGACAAVRRAPWRGLVLLGWTVLPLLLAYLASLRQPVFMERYFLFVVPPYLLLLAWGVAAPLDWQVPRLAKAALLSLGLAVVLVPSVIALQHYYSDPADAKSPDWRGLVRYLRQEFRPGDVVVQNMPDPALTYYLQGTLPFTVQPSSAPIRPERTDQELIQLTRTYSRVWFLPYENPSWDGQGYVEGWLTHHATRLQETTVGEIAVELYVLTK